MRIRSKIASAAVAAFMATTLLAPAAAAAETIYVSAVSFSGPAHGIVSGGYGNMTGFVSATFDAGASWRLARVDAGTWYQAASLSEGADAGVAARLFGGLAQVTGDRGATWVTSTLLPAAGGFEARSADMEGPSNGWVVGENGGVGVILSTADAGSSWAKTYEGPLYPPPDPIAPLPTASLRAVDGADANVAWAVGYERPAGSPGTISRSLVFKTTDGGATWTTQTVTGDPKADNKDVYAVSAVDSRTAFALAGWRDTLYYTTDGVNWSWKRLGTSNTQYLYDISMVSTSTGWAVGSGGRIFRTTDGWATRVAQTSGVYVPLRAVHSIDASSAWAVGDDSTIVYTTDAGTTWRRCTWCVLPGAARESGASRYDTAIEISKATFGPGACNDAVLANGQGFADALASSGLAGSLGGPLLLTRADALPAGVAGELARLGVKKVWIAGGASAVSSDVAGALTGLGFEVERVAGTTRYGTASAIASKVADIEGPSFAKRAFVVRGDGFADALAVSPAAAANGFPVLLTRTGALPAETSAAIVSLGITETVVAGGESAVSNAVLLELQGLVPSVVRKSGASRYGTAAQVSEYAVERGWLDDVFAGVATGRSYADALGGGVSAGRKGGVLLLTDPASLSAETHAFILSHADLGAVAVFGGTSAVSDAVLAQIAALL